MMVPWLGQVLYWLSGLSCTDENFIAKSGAQRAASRFGIALIAPDTSPSKLSTYKIFWLIDCDIAGPVFILAISFTIVLSRRRY